MHPRRINAHASLARDTVLMEISELTCMSREAPRFLALERVSFSTTAAYSFVFAVWGCDQICLSIQKLSAGALYSHKDGLGSP